MTQLICRLSFNNWCTSKSPKERRSRRTAVVVLGRQRGFATEPLEHAIQAINKIIFENEQKRQRQRASRADATAKVEVEVQPVSRPLTFKASARTEKLVKEPAGPDASPRGLSAYLALPLDQYSLLDPGWISRSPAAPDVFVLRIPLFDLVGLELQPQITVRVSLDPRNSQVHFHADQFKVGDPRFDEDFKLNMKATLRNKPVTTLRPFRSIKRMWSRAGKGTPVQEAAVNGRQTGAPSAATAASSLTAAAASTPTAPAAVTSSTTYIASAAGGASSDEEDIILQVEKVDEDEGQSGRGQGGQRHWQGYSSRGPQPSAYERYDPAAPLDVGLGLLSAGNTGARSVPEPPPHVTVVSRERAPAGASPRGGGWAATATASNDGSANSDRRRGRGWGSGGSVDWEVDSGSDRGASSSSGRLGTGGLSAERSGPAVGGSSGGDSSGRHGTGLQGPEMGSSSSGVSSGEGTVGVGDVARGWPAVAYDASLPAVGSSAGPSPSTTRSDAPSTVPQTPPNTTPQTPVAVGRSLGAPAPAGTVARLASVPLANPPPSPALASPAAVTAATSASAETNAGQAALPFIEDAVLYVPASQWGRAADAAAAAPRANEGPSSPQSGDLGARALTPRIAQTAAAAAPVAALPAGAGPSGSSTGASPSSSSSSSSAGRAFTDRLDIAPQQQPRAATSRERTVTPGSPSAPGSPVQAPPGHGASRAPGPGGSGSGARGLSGPGQPTSAAPSLGTVLPPGQATTGTRSTVSDCESPPSATTSCHPAGDGSTARAGTGPGTACAAADAAPGPPQGASPPEGPSPSSTYGPATASKTTAAAPLQSQGATYGIEDSRGDAVPAKAEGAVQDASGAGAAGSAIVAVSPPAGFAGAGGGGSEEGPTALLVGNVDVSVTVMLPPALAAVPRPLLGMTGSLIARYAISSLLPSFLDLLVADYGRWSSGQTVAARAAPAGDLAAVAAANAAAMGPPPGRGVVQQAQQAAAAAAASAAAGATPPSDERQK